MKGILKALACIPLILFSTPAVSQDPQASSRCFEGGGNYLCSAPVITPWRYEADITISRADQQDFRNDCQGRGGVVGDSNGDGVQDCTGAAPWTESNIAPMTKSIAGVWSSCLTGASSDTGWGYRDYYDICKDDYYKYSRAFNWLIIRECRKLTYQTRTCQYPDSAPWDYAFIAIKSRDATCPDGYSLDNGICFLAEPTEECKIGDAEPREKSLHISQNDYSSNDDLLNFDRIWNKSGNQYTPASAAPASSNKSGIFSSANSAQATTEIKSTSNIGIGWRHNYDIRLFEIKGSTNAIAAIYLPDGKMRIYRSNGEPLEIRNEPPTTLIKKIDPDGSVTWIRRNEKNQLEVFGENGRLSKITALDGRFVSLSYNVQGQLEGVTARSGRGLKLTYNEDGSISNIEQPDGTALHYNYTNGNLVKVLKNDGTSISYRYESTSGALQDILDENGLTYQHFDYDNSGRLKRSSKGWASGGRGVESYDYGYVQDKWGYSIDAVIMPNGSTISFNYQFSGGIRRVLSTDGSCATCNSSVQNTYDSIGRLTSKVDQKGTQTSYKYDAAGNKSEIISASNSGSFSQKIQTDWLTEYNLPIQRRYYDAAGSVVKIVKWDYGNDGQIKSHSISDGKDSRISRFEYCTATDVSSGSCPFIGLLKSTDGTRTDVQDRQTYTYYLSDDATCNSPSTCLHRKGDLREVVDNLRRATQYLAYDGAGRPLSIKDANGIVTDYTYHPRGWLTATKVRGADASSEADDRITRIDYWPTGLVKQVTQPDGAFTAFTYDAAHRLTDITDNTGNTVHYTLDNAGNRIKEDTTDASGTLKRTLSRVYNQLGQLKTQATAGSDPTDFEYDANGNATKVTDALATATQSEYDPLNRLSRTLQDVAGIKAETKFDYDALDNLTKVTDPKGLDTSYEYNGFGDLVKLTSPDTGVTSYTYDSAGNRATQTDARGNVTGYGYDALNRLTKATYPTSDLNVAYTYDVTQTGCANGETFSIGRLTKMQDGGAITQYCYNRFGDLVRKVQTSNGKALVLRYDYTVGGQLRRMTYPDGAVVDYVRNTQGQTTEVGVTPAGGSRQVLLGNASYYPFGPAAGWTYGNGRTLARQYDLDYRPQAIQDTRPGGLEVGFGFDPVGNLTALTPAGNSTPEIGLGYDTLGRLTGLKDGRTGTLIDGYSYDATGNRLSAKVGTATQAYTYPADSHRLSAVAGVARSYDATGNTTAIGGTARQYTYDTTGRMTQARRAGAVTMNYRYNGRGEQVRRFLGTTNTYTLYDEAGHWLGDYDTNGAPKQQAIWLDDLPVGLLANASKLHYIEPDHLGSPRVVIDPTRDVAVWTWSLKGEAFGNTAPNQDPDGDGAALVLDMRFPGQRFDAASGLNQNGFRDGYDSGSGRYTQPDPIGLKGGISAYGYAQQTPLIAVDPTGLAAFLTPIPPANQRPAGSIYCVDGVIKPYFNYDLWPKEFQECKDVSDCLMAHEMSHVGDANRASPGLCRRGPLQWMGIGTTPMSVTFPSTPYPGSNYSELDVSEFRAHTVELYCLMSKLKSMNGQCDEKCKAAIVRRIRQITRSSIPAIEGDTYGQ